MIKIEAANTNCRQNRKARVHVIKPQQFSKVFPSLPAESDEKTGSNRQMLNHINVYLITSFPLSVCFQLFIQYYICGNINKAEREAELNPLTHRN